QNISVGFTGSSDFVELIKLISNGFYEVDYKLLWWTLIDGFGRTISQRWCFVFDKLFLIEGVSEVCGGFLFEKMTEP
ncbi:hypothetical protein ACJMK2_034760, partial [Sinanodonta woodiana]